MSIQCPNCKSQEPIGSLFCHECGAQLISSDDLEVTNNHSIPFSEPVVDAGVEDERRTAEPVLNSRLALYIVEDKLVIPLEEQEEITLGRAGSGQPILPDIDLTPYHGYESGVSRLHASIKINSDHCSIIDLGSANGTLLNGKKISPNVPQTITSADTITLGKLKIQLLVQST